MKKILVFLSALILAAALISGCGNGSTDAKTSTDVNAGTDTTAGTAQSQPASGTTAAAGSTSDDSDAAGSKDGYVIETLKQAADGDWGAPNPFQHSTRGPGTQKMTFVFDSLLTAGTKGLIPWLAESYEVSEDGMEYTFQIHKDALWHDGTPVTAADIAFTIDYYREFMPSQDVSYTLGTGENFAIASYEVKDDHTIRITAAKKLASNERNIGSFPIIPKHIWENVTDPYTYTEPEAYIGCGMYRLVSYDSATAAYEFEAFDKYYGYQPAAHYLQFVPVSDALLAFENGEIDITQITADLLERYRSDSNFALKDKQDDMGYKLLINFDRLPELKDLKVRTALYKALNREAMVEAIYRGLGHAASAGHIPQSSIYYTDDVVKYEYSPEEAKSILEPLGISLQLTCEESAVDLAQLIKIDLEAAGVTVEIATYDTATRDSKAFEGDYELLINSHGGWNMTPDYMQTIYSDVSKGKTMSPLSLTSIGYSSETITKLAEAQALETNFDARVKLFQELQVEVSKEIPVLPLITQVQTMVYRPSVYDCWRTEFDFQQFNLGRISYVTSIGE